MNGFNRFGKKSTQVIEWMSQATPLRKTTTVKKKMIYRSLLLSINEITHHFKKWTTGSDVFSLQKRNASNRFS